LLEELPELKIRLFHNLDVRYTGMAFEGYENKAILVRNGIPVDAFSFCYQPYAIIPLQAYSAHNQK
jgi:hypothetical protein